APASPPAAQPARVLTLEEALRTAREHQPQLRQARAGAAAASARADEARAPMLPQLSATGTYERTTANVAPRPGFTTFGIRRPNSSSTTDYWSTGVTLNQVLFDFGQSFERWRAARAAATSQDENETAVAHQAELGVRLAYFTARAARDLVGVARDQVANMQAHLDQTDAFVRAGTHPAIDLALARTNRANAEVQLVNAENGALTAKAQLDQAMGVDALADYEVGDDGLAAVDGEDQPLEPLLAEALQHRPDVASLAAQVRASELTVRAVRGGYGPSVGLFTGFTTAGETPASSVPNWNAGVSLTWNIFQGGLTRAQVREADANAEAARAQLDVLRNQVRVDVEQARLAVRAAKGALAAATTALESAREQLRLAERRYETGVGNAVELGDSQVALATAAAQRVQSDFNLSASRAQLLRALGRELPRG
ncbi:MAG TPA: TolC family protein, partial [Anaeromyxobacter sp.]